MPVERRGWVTHGVCWVNGRPEEPSSFAGRRQPSLSGTSRMRREVHVRLCVQRRLACSAGERPAGARVRSPVVWMALSRRRACSPTRGRITERMKKISYSGYRFPPEVIHQAIWLYLRFTLSLRDVEDLLAERGVAVSYETVRRWVNHFGPTIAANLRKRRL